MAVTMESQPDVQFQSILLELADPNIDAPTKGHYLIKISKMLRKRELDFFAELPNPFDQLFSALIGLLHDSDSYVYLAAINAIVELSFWHTSPFLDRLIEQFINWDTIDSNVLSTSSIHISHSLSVRCKLAEAIAKSFRNIGDFSCVYFQKFSGCLLQLTNSTDPLVRASALSCLSEVVLSCKGRNFDAILNELHFCISQTLATDKDPLVRRSAVFLLRSVLSSLMCYEGHTILESFSDFLTTTTKQLKSLISDDLDDVVRLHAELAYSEIRDLLRKLLAS